MEIKKSDFDRSLDEFLGDVQSARVRFVDAPAGDSYTIRMQRQGGCLRGSIDCISKLNGHDAWQVPRTQSQNITIGQLLLQIASASPSVNHHEFFA